MANGTEQKPPWERFGAPQTMPPVVDAPPWERFAGKKAPTVTPPPEAGKPSPTEESFKTPFATQHPFYAGIAEGFGFDPEKVHRYGWTEATKEGIENLGKFQSSVLKD